MKTLLLAFCFVSAVLAQPSSRPSISVGTDAPAVSVCDRATVGNVYVRSENASNGPIHVLRCTQTGALTYAWQPIGHFVGVTLPGKCAVGDIAFRIGVSAGSNLYGCTAADQWTAQAGGSGGGSPGGSDGQVQYNNTGAFAGDSGLAYSASTKSLGVIGDIVTGQVGTTAGQLKLNGSASGTITIKGAGANGTWSLTLPTSGGTDKYALLTNGSGVSSWGQVDLSAAVTGNLPVTNLGSGTSASASTFWRGDGTWATPAGSGTVTSVGFTGGLVSVATATSTPAFTVAGTSGGIPYFASSSTWASSGALTANLPMFGGGAGAAPIVGTRSGNTTQVVTTTGTQTSGRCVEIDASGNHIASAAGCASGAGDVLGGSALTTAGLVAIIGSAGTLAQDAGLAFNTSTKGLGVKGPITSGQPGFGTGAFLLNGTTSGTVTVSAADAAGTWTWKFPPTAGTNNYVLKTDGTGNTDWVSQAGGHTQNTDTGTTSDTFQIGSGSSGPQLKRNGTALQVRNAADSADEAIEALAFNAPSGTAFQASGATETAPTVTIPTLYFDTTAALPQYLNASSVLAGTMVAPLADPGSDHNWVKYIPTTGVPTRSRPACADLSDAGTGCAGTTVCSIQATFTGSEIANSKTAVSISPGACTLSKVRVIADASISATFDVQRVVLGSWTGTGTGASIVGSGTKPVISSATQAYGTAGQTIATGGAAYSAWTSVTLAAGDAIEVVLSGVTVGSATKVTLLLTGTR